VRKTYFINSVLNLCAIYFSYFSDEVVEDMSRIAAMVQTICDLAGEHIHDYAYNGISPWWQEVRELLLESKQFSGLLVAIVCKTVATNLWRNRKEVGLLLVIKIKNSFAKNTFSLGIL